MMANCATHRFRNGNMELYIIMFGEYQAKIKEEVYRLNLANQEVAIASQIRKYKSAYLNREVLGQATGSFAHFARQISFLISSYCKNIIFVAPQKVSVILDDFSLLFNDTVGKFQQLFLKYSQSQNKLMKQEIKSISDSGLCVNCAAEIKKTEVSRLRKYILNEADLSQIGDHQDQQQPTKDQDLQFFAQVNDLLSMRQGQIIKNQISMTRYEQEALAALKSIQSIKDMFPEETLLQPDATWVTAAKQDMQRQLKTTFNSKVSPWISKMFSLFWVYHRRQTQNKQIDEGIQTVQSTNADLLQIKRKNIVYKQHLDKSQQMVHSLQHQVEIKKMENSNLQTRVEYYHNQLNKLEDQIERIKTENQIMQLKLNRKTSEGAGSEKHTTFNILEGTHSSIRGSAKREKRQSINSQIQEDTIVQKGYSNKKKLKVLENNDKGLPHIKKTDLKSSKQKLGSQTSIKTKSNQASLVQSPRLSLKKITRKSEINNIINEQQDKQNSQRYEGSRRKNNLSVKFKQSLIEQSQTQMEQEKEKIEEVTKEMKEMLKHKQYAKGLGHNYSNSVTLNGQFKDQLRKIPRNTYNTSNLSVREQEQNIIQGNQTQGTQSKEITPNSMSNVFPEINTNCKQGGNLLGKISEYDFKSTIGHIKSINPNKAAAEQFKNDTLHLSSVKVRNQKMLRDRKEWHEDNYLDKVHNSAENQKKYICLFKNQLNAYNYQSSLTKNHQKGAYKLSKQQERVCYQFFQLIEEIKENDFDHYKFICSYIRYPYQIMQNDFGVVNLVNQMSYSNFKQYFQRIVAIHHKCLRQDMGVCKHLEEIKIKLMQK